MTIGGEHVEIGRVVAPIAKVIGGLIAVCLTVAAATGAYYAIVNRIDRIDERMGVQTEALRAVAASLETLASDALTVTDLRAACLEMAIANAKRGWTCPMVSGAQTEVVPAKAVEKRNPKKTEATSLPGIIWGQ